MSSKNIFLAVDIDVGIAFISVSIAHFFSIWVFEGTSKETNISAASEQMNVVLEVTQAVKLWDTFKIESLLDGWEFILIVT